MVHTAGPLQAAVAHKSKNPMLNKGKKRKPATKEKEVSAGEACMKKIFSRGPRLAYSSETFGHMKAWVDDIGMAPLDSAQHDKLRQVMNSIKQWMFPHSARHYPLDARKISSEAIRYATDLHRYLESFRHYVAWSENFPTINESGEVSLTSGEVLLYYPPS